MLAQQRDELVQGAVGVPDREDRERPGGVYRRGAAKRA
jgi:hypothetical protein